MASISGAAERRDSRSGGKIVRPRRTLLRKTPYDRPRLLNSTQQNPNWISRHIFSPTRAIVSDDTAGTNNGQDVSTEGFNNIGHSEPQPFAGKIETKRLIEQLLMQESFSREECNKLTNIIKSRVVDFPMIKGMGLERLNETPNRTGGTDVGIDDLCDTAVIEAKKWLEEKKSGSNSKSEFPHGTSAPNFVTLAHVVIVRPDESDGASEPEKFSGFEVISEVGEGVSDMSVEGEAGSPVDMAKTYMRTRPPWASPSTNNIEFRSPSPLGVPLFKEETPYSFGGKYLSSSKRKRDSPATGSWNIQEEIRKVRSKATQEMLRTLSSPKVDWSSLALEHKSVPDTLAAKNLGTAEEINLQSSKKTVDASEDSATRPVSLTAEVALNSDALPVPATLGCEENQDMEAVQSSEGKRGKTLDEGQRLQSAIDFKTASNSDVDHFKDANGSTLQFDSTRDGTVQGSQIEDKNCSTLKEVAETGGAASTANGLPSSGYSKPAEVEKEENHGAINEEENNTVGSGDENATRVGEAFIEVAEVNENDVAVSDSQHSSSMKFEGEGEDLAQKPNTRHSKRKSNSVMEKQEVKKVSRNNRRGKGRAMEIMLLAEKLEQAENQLAHYRIAPLGPPRKKEESQLAKITRDSAKITMEQVHGLMSQSSRSRKEQSLPKPMVEA
ncbi:hypothetical protein GOBAR_AA22323 [Gossypium barbadense]|uniref:Cop9 signalosome subunit 5 C-terminal domain-containing protein n=1 Tax=Gossypium barbadense TaxID=3634 RepID=A0A2P5X4S7_GOSBA|nr:hypothetical protein GOBAR_AA22323 [Gossypium barbadense]